MTFSMMWVHGESVIAVADSVVTRAGSGRSGTTALGQADVFTDRTVTEAAMKLAMLGDRVLVAVAGDQNAAVACIEALETEVSAGATGPDALDAVSIRARARLSVDVLVGSVLDGRPILSEWSGSGRPKHADGPTARIVGSLPPQIGRDLMAAALETPVQAPAVQAITALQASVHLLMALEPSTLQNGIGGALCGAFVTAAGISYQDRTMWITADESTFDAIMAERPNAGESLGFIFSSVDENRHFVCSSYYEQPFSETTFLAVPSKLSDTAAYVWADLQRDEFFRPETVVFLSLRRKAVVVVPHASLRGSPVQFRREPFGLAIAHDATPLFRRRLCDQQDLGVQVTFHQWWQR